MCLFLRQRQLEEERTKETMKRESQKGHMEGGERTRDLRKEKGQAVKRMNAVLRNGREEGNRGEENASIEKKRKEERKEKGFYWTDFKAPNK